MVTEIALALVLLVGAGLLFNSFVRLSRVDPGFTSENVLAVPISVENAYPQPEPRVQFAHALLERARGVPGVESASLGVIAPFSMGGRCCWMTRARTMSDSDSVRVVIQPVTPGYLETLGIQLLEGRTIDPADAAAEPVSVVITRRMARRLFPDGSAPGKTITIGRSRTLHQVVGVVDDPKFWSLSDDDDFDVFVPFDPYAAEFPFFTLVVRAVGDGQSLSEQLRQAVWSLNASMPVPDVMLLSTRVRESITGPRFMSGILVAFAVFAIVLAAGGIYGTMLYNVSQRSRELGIRLAPGASTNQLLRHVLRAGAVLAGIGITIGLAGAYVASRVLTSLVFGITVQDMPTYAAVTLLLGSVALVACYLPARRAARLDPIATLRAE